MNLLSNKCAIPRSENDFSGKAGVHEYTSRFSWFGLAITLGQDCDQKDAKKIALCKRVLVSKPFNIAAILV